MKFALILFSVLALCAVAVFALPHHLRKPESFKATTLGGIYQDVLADMPSILKPRTQLFLLLFITSVFSAFYPAILVAMLRWAGPAPAGPQRATFVLAGLAAIVGAAINLVLILMSHMYIGFGTSSSTKEQTIFAWLLPAMQAAVGIASVAIGLSTTCAAAMCRLCL